MAYDYDKLYSEQRDALGAPARAFTEFFARFAVERARVLDIGCRQGRDGLFIARLGHDVVGVDLAPNGIRDLVDVAESEGLRVTGIVADIRDFAPMGMFDVIVFDRTLHMLDADDRVAVLSRLIGYVAPDGWVLIADEASNVPAFKDVLNNDAADWRNDIAKRGYLFVQRA